MLTATEHIWVIRNPQEAESFDLETRPTHNLAERTLYRRLLEADPEPRDDNPYCDRDTFLTRLGSRERVVRLKVQHRNGREVRAEFVEDIHNPYPGDDDPNGAGILETRDTPWGTCFIVELEDGTIQAEYGPPSSEAVQPLPF